MINQVKSNYNSDNNKPKQTNKINQRKKSQKNQKNININKTNLKNKINTNKDKIRYIEISDEETNKINKYSLSKI